MDNTRLFLYGALAFLGLLIWEQWKADYGPKPEIVEPAATEINQSIAAGNIGNSSPLGDIPELADSSDPNMALAETTNTASTSGRTIKVETDVMEVLINTRGGVIQSLKLKKYPIDVDHPEDYLELIHQQQDSIYLAQNGLRARNQPAPTHHDIFATAQDSYQLEESQEELRVPFSWTKDGIQVTKTYVFKRADYLIDVDHRIQNNTAQDWVGSQYRQLQRSRPLETSNFLYTYTGAVVYNEEIKYDKVDFDDMEDASLNLQSSGGWTAMIEHYFLSAWIAAPQENNLMYSIANTKRYPATYTIGLRSDNQTVASGASAEFKSQLFVGPKLVNRLEEITPGLELTVDYGWLTFLSKPLYWLLSFFNDIVGNWGFAIILLTLLVKAVFFKLSETSYKSMAKMRKVAPRLKTLKERYGDDRQKMNQAMMDLYKEEKVNPMGGCLPIVVQIPVFIALYWALLESVELRQAPFILWINDLSVMDPYFVLPVIMGVSMLIQQKLNPAPPDPIQAKVMMVLPLVFTVFFAFFPSGLVLYWVVNNVLSITQQYIITRRIEAGQE